MNFAVVRGYDRAMDELDTPFWTWHLHGGTQKMFFDACEKVGADIVKIRVEEYADDMAYIRFIAYDKAGNVITQKVFDAAGLPHPTTHRGARYNPETGDRAYIENKIIEMISLVTSTGKHVQLSPHFMRRALRITTKVEADKIVTDAQAWISEHYPEGT